MPELEDLTPEMKAAIGREGSPVIHEVTAPGIRTFARALGYTNAVYYDAATARAKGHRDLLAPPGFFGMPIYTPNARSDSDAAAFAPEFNRTLNGGNEVEPLAEVCAGDVLEARTTVTDISLRASRLGQMMVVVQETAFRRQGTDEVVARTRKTSLRY